ncbi:hypothetical protein EJB05_37352, partial [Eragrostis curvula]
MARMDANKLDVSNPRGRSTSSGAQRLTLEEFPLEAEKIEKGYNLDEHDTGLPESMDHVGYILMSRPTLKNMGGEVA